MEKYISRTIAREILVPLWESENGELFRGEIAPEGYKCIGTAVVKEQARKYRMKLETFMENAEVVEDDTV